MDINGLNQLLKEGKKPSFDIVQFIKKARGKGYTFHLCSNGSLGVGFVDVKNMNDTVLVEVRIYKEEIKAYLSLEAA